MINSLRVIKTNSINYTNSAANKIQDENGVHVKKLWNNYQSTIQFGIHLKKPVE